MLFEFADVVLVPFPFTDQTASKQPSAVKPIVASLEQGLVIRRLGILDAEDQDTLRCAIGRIVG